MKDFAAKGVDSGLDMVAFAEIQTSKTFIDNLLIRQLGVTEDGIDAAIGDSVSLCIESMEGRAKLLEMKVE